MARYKHKEAGLWMTFLAVCSHCGFNQKFIGRLTDFRQKTSPTPSAWKRMIKDDDDSIVCGACALVLKGCS